MRERQREREEEERGGREVGWDGGEKGWGGRVSRGLAELQRDILACALPIRVRDRARCWSMAGYLTVGGPICIRVCRHR